MALAMALSGAPGAARSAALRAIVIYPAGQLVKSTSSPRPIPTRWATGSRLLLRNNLINNADQGLHGHAIPSGRRGQLVGGCARLGLGGKALDFLPAPTTDLERVEVLPIGIKEIADDGMKPPE